MYFCLVCMYMSMVTNVLHQTEGGYTFHTWIQFATLSHRPIGQLPTSQSLLNISDLSRCVVFTLLTSGVALQRREMSTFSTAIPSIK